MTWARVIATGSGAVAWRAAIDGCPYEPVSHKGMERTAVDGRIRYVGLNSRGLRFSESLALPLAKTSGDGFTIKIADVRRRWTAAFGPSPSVVTYLGANVDSSTTTIAVKSTAGFGSTGTIYLDSETITYTGKTAGPASFTGCSRGAWGSLAQYHYTTFGANLRYPEITDRPRSIEGRRVRVYAYGAGDDLQGNGTVVWVGVANREPVFNGTSWSLSVDSLHSILDVDLGSDLDDPRTIRGIYYSARAPLYIELEEHDADDSLWPIKANTSLLVSGFWENNDAFVADLTTHLATAVANTLPTSPGSFTLTAPRAITIGNSWGFQYVTGATPYFLTVRVTSAVDGQIEVPHHWRNSSGALVRAVAASQVYQMGLGRSADTPVDPGQVPRTTLPSYPTENHSGFLPAANQINVDAATYPATRLYIDQPPLADITRVQIEWPSNSTDGEPRVFTAAVTSVDATAGYIEIDRRSLPYGGATPGHGAAEFDQITGPSAEGVQIRLTRDIATGTVGDLITGLMAQTAQYINTGGVPNIRPAGGVAADFDIAGSELDRLASDPIASNRQYTLLAKVKLRELLEHECRLAGIYICYNDSGQLIFRRMRLPALSESGTTVTSNTITVKDGLLSFERNVFGMYNTVLLLTGYDPATDEHTGRPHKLRDVAAYGANPKANVLEIAPKSIDSRGVTYEDAQRIARRILAVVGSPYRTVKLGSKLTRFAVLLGDVVSLTYNKIPNTTGTLGVTTAPAIVIGREWSVMEAGGSLTLLVPDRQVGGYAPEAKIASIDSGTSGTTGPFAVTLTGTGYFKPTQTAADHIQAGDKFRAYRWNDTTADLTLGTIDSVAGNVVTWTTDTNWTHTGFTWMLGPQMSTAITRANQKVYVHVAGSDMLLDWSDETDQPPFTLA